MRLTERQSQAQSIHFASEACINSLKAIKDTHKMFVGNASSVILNGDFQHGLLWHI